MDNPKVTFVTSMGEIEVELYPQQAPETVKNFLTYARDGFYAHTIFHRVIPGFMIQGGGFTAAMQQKSTREPIHNEAQASLPNVRGSIAMARTSQVHSATGQFFINLVDNGFLNFKEPTPTGYGYCVFGHVTRGMDVVDRIAKVKTSSQKGMQDVPVEPIEIQSVKVSES